MAVQTLAAKVWQPKVTYVNLFQVAKEPTNMYDYTLPRICALKSVPITVQIDDKSQPTHLGNLA